MQMKKKETRDTLIGEERKKRGTKLSLHRTLAAIIDGHVQHTQGQEGVQRVTARALARVAAAKPFQILVEVATLKK